VPAAVNRSSTVEVY